MANFEGNNMGWYISKHKTYTHCSMQHLNALKSPLPQ